VVKLEPRDKGLLLKLKNRKGKDKNIDIKILNSQGIEETHEVVEPKESETEPTKTGELEMQAVGSLFDLKPSELSLFSDKIGTLIDYAKSQTDDHSREGILWAIRSLENKVGTPPLGEKMINYLNKYAWLKLEQKRLDDETKKYERNI